LIGQDLTPKRLDPCARQAQKAVMAETRNPSSPTPRPDRRQQAARAQPGVSSRQLALDALIAVNRRGRALEEALIEEVSTELDPRDRGFARALVTTAIRRRGQIGKLLDQFVPKALPRSAGPAPEILILLATELLFMKVAAHAAVSSAVNLAAADRNAQAFRGLINAVGRRMAAEGEAIIAAQDAPILNTPEWLYRSWVRAHGEINARAMAEVHMGEAPLDISTKGDPKDWAEALDAQILPNGTLRRWSGGRIEALPGFDDGAWWIQDAASSLPTHLFGAVDGRRILDLCAAPGGKTLGLAAKGAKVTAVDRAATRLQRLRENLARCQLTAEVVEADGTKFKPDQKFDGVLIDAPCSSTGTIRRHPDVAWSKQPDDITALSGLQDRLIEAGLDLVAPGGQLIFSTCSLQSAEGIERIERILERKPQWVRAPIRPEELFGLNELITPQGDLRALPNHLRSLGGLDGFFAARLVRVS